MSDQPTADTALASPVAVAAHLEALNLAGLGFATKRLLGKDARTVSGQFTMWDRQDLPPLLSLTDGYWSALSPLRIGRPQHAAAVACDVVLQGRERDPDVAVTAAEGCAVAGKAQFRRAPLAIDPEDTAVQGLIEAVKDYWRGLGSVYGQVRTRVIEGDHARAARLLGRAAGVLEPILERIADGAAAVAGTAGPGAAAAAAAGPAGEGSADGIDGTQRIGTVEHSTAIETGGAVTERVRQPHQVRGALGDRAQTEQRAEAFARAQPVREEPVVQPRPVEVLSTKPVRNHAVAPVVFLLLVVGVALFVIFNVLNAPNPLAS